MIKLCFRCKVSLTEKREEVFIPFHGSEFFTKYICPICKGEVEECETIKKNTKTTIVA